MICVGIDIAKNKHDIHIFNDQTGEILEEHLTILNNREGFNQLLTTLAQSDAAELLIGCEATGHYHFNLVKFLQTKGFSITIINPYDVKLFRDFKKRPKTKNDKIDAQMIAHIVSMNRGVAVQVVDEQIVDLRFLSRYRSKLITKQTAIKIEIHCIVDKLFPEYYTFFKSGMVPTAYKVLASFPSAQSIKEAHLTKLTNLLNKASRGRFDKQTAQELKALANDSVGVYNRSLAFELQELIEQLDFIQAKIKRAESEISSILDEIDSPILTIPGIGPILAAIILSEIGNINRFESAKKLTAYAGLVPTEYQSGKFTASNNHISKHGNKYLRSAIWKAASLIWLHNESFHSYYTMKKAQGKHHNVVIGHITKKLISIIFAVLSKDIAYQA